MHIKKRIVIISDCTDVAYNEMRGKIISELAKEGKENQVIVEPLVSVKKFSIINGVFLTRLVADVYPSDTILMVIINPLKERSARIFGETERGHIFVGANTGTLNWLIEDFGLRCLYEVKDPGFFPFGGKYVYSPLVAKIAMGWNYDELGDPRERQDGKYVYTPSYFIQPKIGTFNDFKNCLEDTIEIYKRELRIK